MASTSNGENSLFPSISWWVESSYTECRIFVFNILPKLVGSVSHSIAILCTVFRLVYRLCMRHFWWEDVWAALALIADVVCLACIWIDLNVSSWTQAVAFTFVLWPARLSIIFSILRLANHLVQKQVIYLIAVCFACMWFALLAQKLTICNFHSCEMDKTFALSQLITDILADIALVAAPLQLLGDMALSRNRKILVLSTFSASFLITIITIPHNIILSKYHSGMTLTFAHVKAALSLVICDLLVIVTFVYRIYSKATVDLDESYTSHGLFTTIVHLPLSTNPRMSLSTQGERTPEATVQSETTTTKIEEASIEEGISNAKDGEP
ncbi:hypothetical protein K503DRAFT_864469 [Rhizopogon vinicolor AM-OR11-026]|uniref:Integral membrane protein n=1 Tax=Rhizopogon vinicolor AM-OR11-026 TaxID=1314800 RepID=A0A1B7N702_9AGAM|nr:hypothetical protein K503DRAFT_864469 [Rhizopogon vinicolor AM-OR11-026]